jgi:hypothetical protein
VGLGRRRTRLWTVNQQFSDDVFHHLAQPEKKALIALKQFKRHPVDAVETLPLEKAAQSLLRLDAPGGKFFLERFQSGLVAAPECPPNPMPRSRDRLHRKPRPDDRKSQPAKADFVCPALDEICAHRWHKTRGHYPHICSVPKRFSQEPPLPLKSTLGFLKNF